jgi:hypothetical protein
MSTIEETDTTLEWSARYAPETPFAEAAPEAEATATTTGFVPWTESPSPFSEGPSSLGGGEAEALLADTLTELRDEDFDEALVGLISETEETVGERFDGEGPIGLGNERERLGDAHLAPIAFEAEQYLEHLSEQLAGVDVESLGEQQLDQLLDRFDPAPTQLTPAGEEFLGALVRKAKQTVKSAATAARRVGRAVGSVIMAGLRRLRRLIGPLLRRVLAIAINRLPAPLRPAATALARRVNLEAEAAAEGEGRMLAAAVPTDPETLAESFDAALAEAVVSEEAVVAEEESFGGEQEDEAVADGRELQTLAEARAVLIDKLGSAAEGEDLAPAVEQFVPALLPALRIGIRLIGRPRVVRFLARYLAQLIGRWVGPKLAGPLSSAIVDTGLRLISLEQGPVGEQQRDGAPAVLAATVEDTVRRLAESEDYVFEDEDLLHLAVSEAFEQAVAANFPADLVRPDLQVAPSLGGSFLPRHPRRVYTYRKYSRVPEVQVTPQLAGALRTFGGISLAAALRAVGRALPLRVRLHVYEATVGTTLPRLARLERGVAGMGADRGGWRHLHPLTPEAAGLLLREPRLGVRMPGYYLRSRHRIAVGQRFYYLEPLGAGGGLVTPQPPGPRQRGCTMATQGWAKVDLIRSEISVALYFSEADAQAISAAINQGRGDPALLRALAAAYDGVSRSFEQPDGRIRVIKELQEGEEFLGPALRRIAPYLLQWLRQKVQEWVMRMLAEWARARAAEFARAAANPACGVTVQLTLRAVPGLRIIRQALNGELGAAALRALTPGGLFQGTPNGSVTVVAGKQAL